MSSDERRQYQHAMKKQSDARYRWDQKEKVAQGDPDAIERYGREIERKRAAQSRQGVGEPQVEQDNGGLSRAVEEDDGGRERRAQGAQAVEQESPPAAFGVEDMDDLFGPGWTDADYELVRNM